jgi:hypothetical protein
MEKGRAKSRANAQRMYMRSGSALSLVRSIPGRLASVDPQGLFPPRRMPV